MRQTVRRPRRRERITSRKVIERRGQAWERLLETAAGLMAARGVPGVSVEQILLASGVSRGTFYGFCSGKTDLLVAILEPVFAAGTSALGALGARPAAEVVPGIIELYAQLWQRHRDALLLIPGVDAAAFSRLRSAHDAYTLAMKRELLRAQNAGYLRTGDAECTFRVITRTAVPLLRVYQEHPQGERLYRESMQALLSAGA